MSNEFTNCMDMAWEPSADIMGELIWIHNRPFKVIVDDLTRSTRIDPRGGRETVINSTIFMRTSEFLTLNPKKGDIIRFDWGNGRIVNNPNVMRSHVVIEVEGLASSR